MTNGVASGQITDVGKANVLSHEVTFDITTTGNITPSWKLLRGTVNQGGTFLTASRDRKHDLTVTFGPLDNTQTALIPVAEAAHTTSLIVTGIRGSPPAAIVNLKPAFTEENHGEESEKGKADEEQGQAPTFKLGV